MPIPTVTLSYKDKEWGYSATLDGKNIKSTKSYDSMDAAVQAANADTNIPSPFITQVTQDDLDANRKDAQQEAGVEAPPEVPLSTDTPDVDEDAANESVFNDSLR